MVQDEGSVTMRIMTTKAGRISNPGSIFGILRNCLSQDCADKIGKIKMLYDQPDGTGVIPTPRCLYFCLISRCVA